MHIHSPRLYEGVKPPYVIQQALPRYHPPPVLGKKLEQLEFGKGQLDGLFPGREQAFLLRGVTEVRVLRVDPSNIKV